MRWAGHVASIGKKRNADKVLVGLPEGKGPLGIPQCRSEDNIKMDFPNGFIVSHAVCLSTKLTKSYSLHVLTYMVIIGCNQNYKL
jgi:hypothetical protein